MKRTNFLKRFSSVVLVSTAAVCFSLTIYGQAIKVNSSGRVGIGGDPNNH